MKKLTTLLMVLLFSSLTNAQINFDVLWEQVQKFEVDNLPKSALKIVEKVFRKAEKEKNTPQIIKSLFYKSKFSLILEEDAQLNIINNFKKHISKSKFPTKNILENILANLYWQYFNQNRYKFYNRTKTATKVDETDFRTWDLDTLFKEIHCHYEASLENETALQKATIYDFAPILEIQKESKEYRPSLYDFLANNALTFYKTSETSITKPSHQFKIDNPDFLSDFRFFSELNLTSKDSFSLQFNALQIYQKLIQFHLKENNLQALVHIDIDRINFVKLHGSFKDKKAILSTTLNKSYTNYKNNEVGGLYAFEIAKNHHTNSENKLAISICDQIIQNFPKSLGAKKCAALKLQIKQTYLTVTAEEYIPIKENSRLLINYKNIDELFFTAYKISKEQLNKFNKTYKFEERIQLLNSLEKANNWRNTLRNENDYLQHTTETILPIFNNGLFLIVASESEILNKNKIYGSTQIQITNLTLIENNFDGRTNYQIVDRVSGKPIKGAKIHLKNQRKNRGKFIDKTVITDKNGFASLKNDNYYQNVEITVKTKDDFATFVNHYLYKNESKNHTDNNADKTRIKPFIFTDRSIYRPGQTVFFKAIVIKKEGDISEIFRNEFVGITLKDVNNQIVKTIDLKLNEFGSVAGEFIIPNNGITGNYTLEVKNNSKSKQARFDYNRISIAVEEYKRPKFKTEFRSITQTYKINDAVTIKGFAKSFSGSNITDAKVVYSVQRKVQYPNWYYWRRPNFNSESQEITNGEIITDDSGNFSIKFKSIPDESVSKESLPIFNYEITADVTDISGETRSATTIVKVGYHSLLATISINNKVDKNSSENKIIINTKNLNGEFLGAKGILKIYKLKAPKNPLRKRPWPAPDYQDISENKFRTLFPNDSYTNEESEPRNWKKGRLVFNSKFDTDTSNEIDLKNIKNWISGKYIIVLESKDRFGQTIKDEKLFNVFIKKEKDIVDNQLFVLNTDKTIYEIGDIVEINIGSASKNMTVILQVEKNYKIIETCLYKLNNSTKTIKIPIDKSDLGGFALKYHFVKYNYFESGSILINVPEKLDNIEIETNIFRDKLQPGQEETWSFTIKNDKNDAVAAEVLASMYDASLDEFKPHNWSFNPISPKQTYASYSKSTANYSFKNTNFNLKNNGKNYTSIPHLRFDTYNWFGFRFGRNKNVMFRGMASMSKKLSGKSIGIEIMEDEMEIEESVMMSLDETDEDVAFIKIAQNQKEIAQEKLSLEGIQIRKNFQETAFFFPQLTTDKNGKVHFSFIMPEALTKWKLQLLAHTKDLKSVTKSLQTITQKELMIVPNAPRFLREKDTITLSAKITNLTNNQLSGFARLILTDAITRNEVNIELQNLSPNKKFSVDKEGNTNVSWKLSIPETVQAVQYKIVAKAGDFSDGEQNVLPVLSNRMLVTETLPMRGRSNETKTFTLKKLKNNTSSSLKNHKLTLEMTSNPVWYAIQALPYLMEYPYECSEQTFARYYANTLASFLANSNPRIQEVFNAWKSSDALLSNLEKNQELKSLIIQETPWLRDAQSETEQKKRIALLFDLNKMKNAQEKSINKLKDMQLNSGGFPWFKGGSYESNFITQHIATGFGHLQKLGVSKFEQSTQNMIDKSVQFLDREILRQYDKLLERALTIKGKAKTEKQGEKKYHHYLSKNHLSYFTIQYLYMRSFYNDYSMNSELKSAFEYYQDQSIKYWNDYNLYAKGQIALSLFRNDKRGIARKILKSLKENSITSDELGMYWKSNTAGYYNYQAPVETQALMIEVFSEIDIISTEPESAKRNLADIDHLKIWLLKNKQTNRWKTTKATTEAVYALLLNGTDWFSITEMVAIKVGDKNIDPSKLENVKIEAGTGYFKTSWNGSEITPKMSEVTISKKGNGIAWGGLYWQYFEDLDKITSTETPLKINKKLFLKVNSNTGKLLKEIDSKTPIKIGDLITVRLELRSHRDMEFIHMKDMRASGVEPINVLSKYKWQDNLGYYESTKDAVTNFFFDRLSKGIYVFEYDVRVNNAGNFSNGITTIQSMYAPEFSSHSKGERMKVSDK